MFRCEDCERRALWRTWEFRLGDTVSLACNNHTRSIMVSLPRFGPGAWRVLNALMSIPRLSTLELIDEVWPGRAFGGTAGTLNRLADVDFIARVTEGRKRMINITPLGERAQRRWRTPA